MSEDLCDPCTSSRATQSYMASDVQLLLTTTRPIRRREYEEQLEVRMEERRRENVENRLCLPRITLDPYRWMGVLDVTVGKEEIGNIMGKLKGKKAAGCDGLKPELYKALAGSEVVIEALERGFGRVLELGEVPEGWKRSRTVMMPKKKRPNVADLRPIAMTDISYKMLMSILRERLEEHIEVNGMRKDEGGVYRGRKYFGLFVCFEGVCGRSF